MTRQPDQSPWVALALCATSAAVVFAFAPAAWPIGLFFLALTFFAFALAIP